MPHQTRTLFRPFRCCVSLVFRPLINPTERPSSSWFSAETSNSRRTMFNRQTDSTTKTISIWLRLLDHFRGPRYSVIMLSIMLLIMFIGQTDSATKAISIWLRLVDHFQGQRYSTWLNDRSNYAIAPCQSVWKPWIIVAQFDYWRHWSYLE